MKHLLKNFNPLICDNNKDYVLEYLKSDGYYNSNDELFAQNVIFIDIDGVFTSARTGWYNFDIYAVNFIRWVCEKSNSKLVVSSTWRKNHNYNFFASIFGEEYLHKHFRTTSLRTIYNDYDISKFRRGLEIDCWLKLHNVNQYLILDDDSDMLDEQKSNFIKTDTMDGLSFENMLKIREFFNIEEFPKEIGKLYIHDNMFCEGEYKL